MQVTSTTDPAASERSAGGGPLLARLNNPIPVGLIGFIGWLIYVVLRWQVWARGHISKFIMSGSNNKYSHPAQMFPHISHVPSTGYDGQFYYRFAFNPFNWNPTAYGITVDHNYRYTRIGYSLVAYIISLGGHGRLLPTVLVVVNLVCVGVMGYLGARFATESGRHALWGLLFVAYFGLAISVGRDTAEPLADACMLGGLLAYRHSRYVLAALLVAYGVFTNEPILVLSVAIALVAALPVLAEAGQAGHARPDLGAARRRVRAAPDRREARGEGQGQRRGRRLGEPHAAVQGHGPGPVPGHEEHQLVEPPATTTTCSSSSPWRWSSWPRSR